METLPSTIFDDFDDPQVIWEIFGELLDFFDDGSFTSEQVSRETGHNKQLINKALHRLSQHKAVICTATDHWGVKSYRLNEKFIA